MFSVYNCNYAHVLYDDFILLTNLFVYWCLYLQLHQHILLRQLKGAGVDEDWTSTFKLVHCGGLSLSFYSLVQQAKIKDCANKIKLYFFIIHSVPKINTTLCPYSPRSYSHYNVLNPFTLYLKDIDSLHLQLYELLSSIDQIISLCQPF